MNQNPSLNLLDCVHKCEKSFTDEVGKLYNDVRSLSTEHKWAVGAGVVSFAAVMVLGRKFQAFEELGCAGASAREFVAKELPDAASLLPESGAGSTLAGSVGRARRSFVEFSEELTSTVGQERGLIRKEIGRLAESDRVAGLNQHGSLLGHKGGSSFNLLSSLKIPSR